MDRQAGFSSFPFLPLALGTFESALLPTSRLAAPFLMWMLSLEPPSSQHGLNTVYLPGFEYIL